MKLNPFFAKTDVLALAATYFEFELTTINLTLHRQSSHTSLSPVAPEGALLRNVSPLYIMHFPTLPTSILVTLALHYGVNGAASSDKKDEKVVEPCTVASATGAFYDLRSLSIAPPADDKKPAKGEKVDDWHAKGYDYHDSQANFTLNICAPVVSQVGDFVGVEKDMWRNVSAYYELEGKRYSIG